MKVSASEYLKYEALNNGKSSGCKGMEAEHHIVELDRVDSSWEAMKILTLDKRSIVTVSNLITSYRLASCHIPEQVDNSFGN